MIKNFVKNGILISSVLSILGIYYLFIFTYFEEIPFPLDMSVLPAVFLPLGILCVLITIIILIYSLMSAIVLPDHMDISYSELFYAKPNWIESKKIASFVNFGIFFCLTPLISYVASVFNYQWAFEITIVYLFFIPFLFSYYALTPSENIFTEKGKYILTARYLKTVFTFLCISILSLCSLIIFIKYVVFVFSIKSDHQYLAAIAIFIVSSYFILIPVKKRDAFQINAKQNSTVNDKSVFMDVLHIPAFYVFIIALIFSLIPPIAAKTSAISFKFLNIGGGIERSYYFTKKSRTTVPPDLIDHCNSDDYCVTKNLYVILDLGGVLYVKGNYFDREETIISLPRQHLNVVRLGKEKIKN
jgi:hypothetical protein